LSFSLKKHDYLQDFMKETIKEHLTAITISLFEKSSSSYARAKNKTSCL